MDCRRGGDGKVAGPRRVRILNDLEATGIRDRRSGPSELVTIHDGVPAPQATKVVIAAGTGLGEADSFLGRKQHLAMADRRRTRRFCAAHGAASRALEIYQGTRPVREHRTHSFGARISDHTRVSRSPVKHAGFDDPAKDPAPEITRRGLSGECPVCAATLDLWVEIYGSEAGNLAVRTVARGRNLCGRRNRRKNSAEAERRPVRRGARDKEKMGDFLAQVPIHVVLNEECPLLGRGVCGLERLVIRRLRNTSSRHKM